VITDLKQLSENGVRIQWSFASLNYLLRYRVEISSDNFENTTYEWPGNFEFFVHLVA